MATVSHNVYSIYKQGMTLNSLVRQAIKLYPVRCYSDKRAVNALRRGWIQAVARLGERWILHPVHRRSFVRGAA